MRNIKSETFRGGFSKHGFIPNGRTTLGMGQSIRSTIRVTVTDKDNHPMANIPVIIKYTDETTVTETTGGDGAIVFGFDQSKFGGAVVKAVPSEDSGLIGNSEVVTLSEAPANVTVQVLPGPMVKNPSSPITKYAIPIAIGAAVVLGLVLIGTAGD